jgi:uncharacterized protein YjbI with pentapeptide repeats
MYRREILELLRSGTNGVRHWNLRRGWDEEKNRLTKAHLSRADLSGADLSGADLRRADLSSAHFSEADLSWASLSEADLVGADLSGADLRAADLSGTDLRGADLSGAFLSGAFLSRANLYRADLRGADLTGAVLVEAHLRGADLRGANLSRVDLRGAKLRDCPIFGISAWNIKTNEDTEQINLIISDNNDPVMTVDNVKVAQFIYLLLNNEEIRDVIDTITSKVVLILGRFTPERKALLDAVREALRHHDYLPILFDFQGPASRGYTETVSMLARMARFVIADLTDATEVRFELGKVVPELPSVPVQPLILAHQEVPVSIRDLRRSYHWVLEPFRYDDPSHAIASLPEKVLGPAEAKVAEIRGGEGRRSNP